MSGCRSTSIPRADETVYDAVETEVEESERVRVETIRTPVGTLTGRRERAPLRVVVLREHLVQTIDDLEIIEVHGHPPHAGADLCQGAGRAGRAGRAGFIDLVLLLCPCRSC